MSNDTRREPDFSSPEYYLNRELSELEFQRRVLHEAQDARNPLLERVRALHYFGKNTDEFFMKRIGGLKLELEVGMEQPSADGRTPYRQWRECLELFRELQREQYECWRDNVKSALRDAGLRLEKFDDLPHDTRSRIRDEMQESVLPLLTPLAFDPAHPFPLISNLSVSLGVFVESDGSGEPTFTRIKVPQNREPVLVASRDESVTTYVSLADVIGSNLDLVLPGKRILASSLFRVTRSAEVKLEEEVAEDLVEMIYDVLEKRRTAHPVRLEVSPDMPDDMLSLLSEQLDVDEYEVYRHAEPMTLRNLEFLTHLDRPDLKYPAWSPEPHRRLEHDESSIFDEIKRGDILLHHPYHSFELTTQRFFNEIARDPDVLAIKVALYRTANDSKVIQALMDAGDRGKQVAAIVELKARFDERRNVAWVQRLEEKGIHVAYGMIDMKTHTKIALAVRREEDGLRFYSHVGTGNYHSQTAKTYVDLGLLTADESIGRDLMHVFNMFTGPLHEAEYNTLLVAPFTMKDRFRELIRRERELAGAGKPARIVAKVNAVEDVEMCRELYEAARTGVDIDLICRDICRIRPGLDGITDSLRVHSVVGRFLEHSRIFYFHNDGDPLWYLGSADWMTRNLDRRMEAVTPVRDPRLQRELRNVLEAMLSDNRRRWAMQSDGSYRQLEPNDGTFEFDAQHYLMERARWAARGVEHPLPEHAASIASGDQ